MEIDSRSIAGPEEFTFPEPKIENVYQAWKPIDYGHPLVDATIHYAPPELERVQLGGGYPVPTRPTQQGNSRNLVLRRQDPKTRASRTTDCRPPCTMAKVDQICRFVAAKVSRFRSSSARHCGYDSFTAKERRNPAGSAPWQEPSDSETASTEVGNLLRGRPSRGVQSEAGTTGAPGRPISWGQKHSGREAG